MAKGFQTLLSLLVFIFKGPIYFNTKDTLRSIFIFICVHNSCARVCVSYRLIVSDSLLVVITADRVTRAESQIGLAWPKLQDTF